MSPSPLPELPPSPQNSFETISLVISLCAEPSARLTHEISVVLNQKFAPPYTFLGSIDDALTLELRLSDLGLAATEALARRLLKLKGVRKLVAKRVCHRRGEIYAISLRSVRI